MPRRTRRSHTTAAKRTHSELALRLAERSSRGCGGGRSKRHLACWSRVSKDTSLYWSALSQDQHSSPCGSRLRRWQEQDSQHDVGGGGSKDTSYRPAEGQEDEQGHGEEAAEQARRASGSVRRRRRREGGTGPVGHARRPGPEQVELPGGRASRPPEAKVEGKRDTARWTATRARRAGEQSPGGDRTRKDTEG